VDGLVLGVDKELLDNLDEAEGYPAALTLDIVLDESYDEAERIDELIMKERFLQWQQQ
jgi:hypothetical protein